MAITLIAVVLFSLFSVSFSSIFYILIFGAVGLLVYAISFISGRGEKSE